MTEESIPINAIGTPIGSYEGLVMPMGIATLPSIFQRKIDDIIEPH